MSPGSKEEGTVVPLRRSRLPSPSPQIHISLWDILRNNVGKELSKVKMPVQFNEPLNTLQRMCEELEYCELLEKAADTPDPFQRMVRWLLAQGKKKPFTSVGQWDNCNIPRKRWQ